MSATEQLLDHVAGAILDGAVVDWAAAESSADASTRALLRHLRLVSMVAQTHRELLPVDATPTSATTPPSANQWGHLRLIERVGQGSFGEVFRAWDTRLDREVALKLIPAPASADRATGSYIIEEGRLLARVRHPNVVTIYGAEQIGDRIGLWMEFVNGRTLEQWLDRSAPLREAEVVSIGVDICSAVSAVHAAGLLHRDIKAQNVTRADDGRIVLMDFGTGRELGADTVSDLTGTPLYLAPEVLAGQPATVRSDIYSLGVLLYRLTTRAYPVRGRTLRDVRDAHERNERVDVRRARPELRPRLARAIDRACAARPENRYETATALATDLRALQRRPGVGRRRLALIAAVLLFALAVWQMPALRKERPRSAPGLSGATEAATRPVANPVIVVLPLRNLGVERDRRLVDSVTAGLIRQLSIIDGVEAKSQTTSFMLRNRQQSLPDIGRQLGVNLVVEGDAQLKGADLRIRVAMLSVATGMPLASENITRHIASQGDVVAVVEELTRTMVNRLRLKLGRTQRRYDDIDFETLMVYLHARELRDARGTPALQAIELFKEVLRRAPEFAPAQAALAASYGGLALTHPSVNANTIPPREAAALMEPLVRGALAIDPTLAEAHASMGLLDAFALRWADAEASFEKALYYEPNLTAVHGDLVLSTLLPWGRTEDALQTMAAALRADPMSLDVRRNLAHVQLSAGLYEEALENCRRVREVDPTITFMDETCTWARFFKGDRTAALEELERFARGARDGRRRPGAQAWIDAINGRRAEAEAIAADFAAFPQRQAVIYGLMGDRDRAFEALERLAAINPIRAGLELTRPEVGVSGDPRVETFRRKLRFPER